MGIAVTTTANLGTTAISSLPYVLSFIFPVSFGVTTFIVNIFFLILQKLILGKDFEKRNYLQVIVTLFFGTFIDLGMYIAAYFKTDVYFEQVIMLVTGSAMLALGIVLEFIANLIYVPGEGLVRAITKKFKFDVGKTKVVFDVSHCIIAIVLSLSCLRTIKGLREGTIISAFLVGIFVSIFHKILQFYRSINNTKSSKV